jgi:hypothetical protein
MNDHNSAALLAEAKSLDHLISNLEVEAFRHSSGGAPHRAMESARRAKDLRERRAALLEHLRVRQVLGQFDGLGAPPSHSRAPPRISEAALAEANRLYAAAERDVLSQEKVLGQIAKRASAKGFVFAPGTADSDIAAAYSKLGKAVIAMMEANGTREAYSRKSEVQRTPGERLQGQRAFERHEKFWSSLPKKLTTTQAAAFLRGRTAFRTLVLQRLRAPSRAAASASKPSAPTSRAHSITCRPGERCFSLAGRIAATRRRAVAVDKLRAPKKRLSLRRGARLPDALVLRLIGNRIAKRYPRPSSMKEEVYGDLILELTKRAAIHTANAQAEGISAPKAAEAAAAQVVSQDLAAVKEEVTTGVSAPAGEQAAAAAVTAAAAQVLQGAADAGTLPSVPAAPAAVQAQVLEAAASAAPAAAAAAAPEVAVSVTESVEEFTPDASSAEASPTDAPDSTAASDASEVAEGDAAAAVPFYKKPLFWLAAAGAVGLGYMVLREKEEVSGEVPAPAPVLAE